jgi:hypothetical protein
MRRPDDGRPTGCTELNARAVRRFANLTLK